MPKDLTRSVSCPDCGWKVRRLGGAPDGELHYVERYCEGECGEVKLFVSRGTRLVAAHRLFGRDWIALRDTLRSMKSLSPDDRQLILQDALRRREAEVEHR